MLSLIIPVYNEEGSIEDIVRRSSAILNDDDEIIIVNDGSTDRTAEIISNLDIPKIKIIQHEKNIGNGASIVTGLNNSQGEWIATIDADNTYSPEDIPILFDAVKQENADMVTGLRETLMHGPLLHTKARSFLKKMSEVVSHSKIADINSGLRIMKREVLEKYVHLYPKRFSLHIVLTICASRDNYKVIYRPIKYGSRIGTSKLSPGLKGPFNFLKFLGLIALIAIKKH
ncbi:MAG: glycosyltransferase family 2 protein [Kiritimatiellales bacterium]|nr:glycosyltransferase family 2 protein [Kiritimatiellales bacterium]